MLLKGHRESFEKLQRFALRVCFGEDPDIRAMMATLGIKTLEARRTRRVNYFVTKPCFAHWFPPRNEPGIGLRNRRLIAEDRTRTERRFNGPLAYFKRRANDLGLSPAAGR